MSKAKQKIRVSVTTTNNSDECAQTSVYLVDDNGKHVGVAVLKTKPGMGLHYRFENSVKTMVKELKTFI